MNIESINSLVAYWVAEDAVVIDGRVSIWKDRTRRHVLVDDRSTVAGSHGPMLEDEVEA